MCRLGRPMLKRSERTSIGSSKLIRLRNPRNFSNHGVEVQVAVALAEVTGDATHRDLQVIREGDVIARDLTHQDPGATAVDQGGEALTQEHHDQDPDPATVQDLLTENSPTAGNHH